MGKLSLSARVVSGGGQGAHFTQLPWVREAFLSRLGIDPFPGTLNLKIEDSAKLHRWQELKSQAGIAIPPPSSGFCRARCYLVVLPGGIKAAIVYPEVPDYPDDQMELIASASLRERLKLQDGDRLDFEVVGAGGLA